ncbi:acyltransferase [Pedobacter sp. SD-b]|uniref:Acyltransferase n=1 Tax=Pedobacter segetis TaxID=2793069 RepID=A0ABS1BGS4_9SPHI|nr:acyltransferase [Pedobacter segetis]MBK0382063.1 acyltransferase [Pedobacter segetis]
MSEKTISKSIAIKTKDPALKMLDILRGLAAFYVVMAHARWILWEGFSSGYVLHPQQYNFFDKFLMYLFSAFKYGHFAVIFFFVLSGFVIHLRQANNGLFNKVYRLDLGYYFNRRLTRIYPPFIISLLLTFALDSFGKQIYTPIYTGAVNYTLSFLHLNTNFDLVFFLKNLFFLQKDNSELWGSNPVIWSLQMEWWFYMIYPIMLFLNKKSFIKMTAVVFILSLIAIIAFEFYPNMIFKILGYFLLWWFGATLSEIYIHKGLHQKVSYSFLVLFLIVPSIIHLKDFYADLIFAIGVCGIISTIFYTYKYHQIIKWPSFLTKLGKFSYTLYLVHSSIFIFIAAIYMRANTGHLPSTFYLMIVGVGFVLLFSNYLYFITEKPFLSQTKRKLPSQPKFDQ